MRLHWGFLVYERLKTRREKGNFREEGVYEVGRRWVGVFGVGGVVLVNFELSGYSKDL